MLLNGLHETKKKKKKLFKLQSDNINIICLFDTLREEIEKKTAK